MVLSDASPGGPGARQGAGHHPQLGFGLDDPGEDPGPHRVEAPTRPSSTLAIDVSCVLRPRIASSCSLTPVRAGLMAAASTSTSLSLPALRARGAGRDESPPPGCAGSGASGSTTSGHRPDHGERRDTGGRVRRRAHASGDRAPRFSRASRSSSRIARRRHHAVLGLDHQPDVRAAASGRIQREHEVALLGAHQRTVSVPVRSSRSPAPRASSPSIPSSRSSKSPPLAAERDRSSARARLAASMAVRRSWTPRNPSLISCRNWCSGEPRRVGSRSRASLEASPSKYVPSRQPHPADRRVPLGLVEQLVDEGGERATVAKEPLERAREPSVAIGEVRPGARPPRLGRPARWRPSSARSASRTRAGRRRCPWTLQHPGGPAGRS